MSQQATAFDWLDAVSNPVFVLQANRILWANTAATILTEYDAFDLRDTTFHDLLAPAWRNGSQEIPMGALELISARGTMIRAEVALKATQIDGEMVTVATVTQLHPPKADARNQIQHEPDYRSAVERSLDGFYLLQAQYDDDGRVSDFTFADLNAQGEKMVPYTREEMIGHRLCDLFPIYRSAGYIDQYASVLQSGEVLDTDFEFPQADGDSRWYHHQVIPLGQQVAVFSRSMTERKRTEHALHESENRYRALFNQSNAYVTLIDLEGRYLLVNQKFATMMGYRAEEMTGRHISEFMPPQETPESTSILEAIREGQEIPLYERVFRRKDGTEFLGEIDVTLVRDSDGAPLYIQSIIRDATARVETQKALGESEERYRIISELISDYAYAFRIEPDGTFVHEWITDDSFERITGYTHQEIDALGQFSLLHPEDVSATPESIEHILKGEPMTQEYRIITKRGEIRWMRIFRQPVWDEKEQRVVRMYGIAQDITKYKQAEEELRHSEERYRIISELIYDYAYSVRVEPDGTMAHEWMTESFKRITGYAYEEVDPATAGFSVYHPDEEARIDAARLRVINGETVTDEYRIITKSGEQRWLEIVRRPVWDEKEQRVVRMYGVAQDITERKRSEEELRRNEEQYRLIAENVTDMITRTSVDGIRTYVSPVCRVLLGYEPEEMLGQHSSELIHPDDMEDARKAWDAITKTSNPVTFTCRMRHKNGNYIWFEVVSKAILTPGTDEIGEYVAVSRDISERKRMDMLVLEQERLRYELQKEQELNEVKSNLMRTISHEFRTPLALIVTSTDFLDTYIERLNTEQRKERLQAIRVQVKRLSDMLNDISFVVQGTLHRMNARKSMITLEGYCRTILEEISTTIGKSHQFVFETDHQLEQGMADKALIIRMLTNLLSNAVKYSPEDSTITLRLLLENGDALLQVSDQGIGIEPEEQKHIFEPFYRGSSVMDRVGGTGLGLSIVKDCVDLHGGSISVESVPDSGTTFTIRLPQAQDEP